MTNRPALLTRCSAGAPGLLCELRQSLRPLRRQQLRRLPSHTIVPRDEVGGRAGGPLAPRPSPFLLPRAHLAYARRMCRSAAWGRQRACSSSTTTCSAGTRAWVRHASSTPALPSSWSPRAVGSPPPPAASEPSRWLVGSLFAGKPGKRLAARLACGDHMAAELAAKAAKVKKTGNRYGVKFLVCIFLLFTLYCGLGVAYRSAPRGRPTADPTAPEMHPDCPACRLLQRRTLSENMHRGAPLTAGPCAAPACARARAYVQDPPAGHRAGPRRAASPRNVEGPALFGQGRRHL